MKYSLLFLCALLSALTAGASNVKAQSSDLTIEPKPIVIGHRGASGIYPEHTMPAYQLAADQGADYIEPDLVLTKDNIFVARHDVYLSTTTDVASRPEFAHLKTTKYGRTDWFVEDFTLAQIKKLRAIQPFAHRDQSKNGTYQIPTLDDILIYTRLKNKEGTSVGVYPEIKHQPEKAKDGVDVSKFVAAIKIMQAADIRFYIQSFNAAFLERLHKRGREEGLKNMRLIQLIYKKENGEQSVASTALPAYIHGVGIDKSLLVDTQMKPTGYLSSLQEKGFKVHVWTVRDDQLPAMFKSAGEELTLLKHLGADGVFTDFPKTAVDLYKKKTEHIGKHQK